MDKLLTYFTPTHYQLNLRIDRQTETLEGIATITGQPHAERIRLHAVNLQISDLRVNDQKLDYIYNGEEIAIALPEGSHDTELSLQITYSAQLSRDMQGCYLSTYEYEGCEERIVTTQYESHYARRAFPCIDEPAAKAIFSLSLDVSDFTEGDVVLANTPLASRDGNVFTFQDTPRMSTYLLAWVIGKFHKCETTNKNGVIVATYGALNQPESSLIFANETAARALEYYDEQFGHKYPLPKLDQVAIPDFEAGAMENWGLVTYRESMLLATPEAAISTKASVAVTITHELSHQWFGDLVTMAWWDDLWLNESFASIMEYYCADTLYPEFYVWEDFYTSDCVAALRRDALPGVQAVKQEVNNPEEIATLFDGAIVYAKGARLILMLIHLIGRDNFNKGLRDYFQKYQYQNTVGDDLWAALQPYADFNIKELMDAWISRPGYPAIDYGEKTEGHQSLFRLTGLEPCQPWPLPKIYDDMSGHYLLNLSEAEFSAKLDNFVTLSVEQKLRLLLDRSLLARTPAVPSASLIDLVAKFTDESSGAVCETVSGLVGDLKLFCPQGSENGELLQNFVHTIFAPAFQKLDLGDLGGDSNAIRRRDALLGLALYSCDPEISQKLCAQYDDDLAKIHSELLSAVLLATLRSDEPKYFPEFLAKYQAIHDPEIKSTLLAVLASHSKEHNDELLALLSRPEIVRPQDHLFLFIYLLRNHKTHAAALTWLYDNWNYVEKLTGEKSIEDYARYAAGAIRTAEEAKAYDEFFAPLSARPVLKRTIEVAHHEIAARLALIASDAPAVHDALRRLIG